MSRDTEPNDLRCNGLTHCALLQDAFPGEGDAKDYIVSSLFGSDFAFNMFNNDDVSQVVVKQPVARQVTSRRMLIVKQEQASEGLQASFGTQSHRTLRRQ